MRPVEISRCSGLILTCYYLGPGQPRVDSERFRTGPRTCRLFQRQVEYAVDRLQRGAGHAAARVHHAAWRRGGVAAFGMGATADTEVYPLHLRDARPL